VRTLLVSLCLCLLSAATSCASGLSDNDRLAEAVSHFNDDVRWGRWESASIWMAPAARQAFLRDLRRTTAGGDLQNADYEVVGMMPIRGGGALVRVERSWYLLSENELHQGTFVQRWEQRGSSWRMIGERPLSPN
jgi:hypothetical protein